MDVYARLRELGITLPEVPGKAGLYMQAKEFSGNMVYVSGCGPDLNGVEELKGRLGEISIEDGQLAAKNCMLNALAVLHKNIGSLNRVKSVVKMLAFVSSAGDFYAQPLVANGASQLLIDVFGHEAGCPSRSAIGVNILPGNIPVEIELLVELEPRDGR